MEYLESYVLELGVCHLLHKFTNIQHLNTQTLSQNWEGGDAQCYKLTCFTAT